MTLAEELASLDNWLTRLPFVGMKALGKGNGGRFTYLALGSEPDPVVARLQRCLLEVIEIHRLPPDVRVHPRAETGEACRSTSGTTKG